MQTICMDGQWVDVFLMVDLSGYKMLIILMYTQLKRTVQQYIFSKLILNILKNYTNCTMIIH